MSYFGTDGIRCEADLLTTEFIAKIAKGLVRYAESQGIDSPRVFLAGDTRESSEWILQDFCRAFETLGIEYGYAGILPTPAINHAFYEMGFDYAIDVTASHNPYYDNGVKVSERGEKFGIKLGKEGREFVEKELTTGQDYELAAVSLQEDLHDDALDRYVHHLREYVGRVDYSDLRIGIDCANGAQGVIGGQIFEELGAEVVVINDDISYGTMINKDCGSTHLEKLSELVVEQKLDFGIAFDGDGDRCMMVDAHGEVVDGDQILVVLAEFLQLNALATTLESNPGLDVWAKERGVQVILTDVGDENVAHEMRQKGIQLGGEQCGHVILPEEPFGDGMLVGLMMTKAVAVTRRNLSELAGAMKKMPRVAEKIEADSEMKEAFQNSTEAAKLVKEYSEKFTGLRGRLLVRPSGTEPIIRITAWGEDGAKAQTLANELKGKLKETLKTLKGA